MLGFVDLLAFENGSNEGAKAFARVVNGFAGFERREFCFLAGTVFEGVGVQREDFFFAGPFYFFVEALAGFVAEHFAFEHFFDEWRNFVTFARLVIGRGFVDILDDVDEDVEADDVRGAEGGGFGPPDGRAGAGVNFFDGHAERLHEAKSIEHGKRADAIGDEIGGIFCGDDALAEAAIAEFGERGEDAGESFRTRYNLDQL